ncbi:hypothetical protein AVEN_207764-1 [Araneus ventricosus]|uniref:Uncharacterized protein n=1 Tax=Araneus ventricosus TaxID=182803 RepID=A0A4Y2BWM5_ARAVE|nr:hypothetical protein AVEN_207764-1 [Araneus ventricosus]
MLLRRETKRERDRERKVGSAHPRHVQGGTERPKFARKSATTKARTRATGGTEREVHVVGCTYDRPLLLAVPISEGVDPEASSPPARRQEDQLIYPLLSASPRLVSPVDHHFNGSDTFRLLSKHLWLWYSAVEDACIMLL